ncbi:MAG: YihY/virulence factor BrkB family protein [Deinococcales bacterium]|nr:YihY/virulence factor BrkB family protein [Chitinophagaceae bacterium]
MSIWKMIKKTISEFSNDNGMKLSASLSFYTVFSIAPLLIIAISLAGFFFGADAVQGKVYAQLRHLISDDAALQIQDIIKNMQQSKKGFVSTTFGIIFLFIGASSVFLEIQDSMNFIWSIKAKPKKDWLRFLTNRLLSFSLILGMGFVLMVSLFINAIVDLLSDRLQKLLSSSVFYLTYTLNIIIVISITTVLFAIIFKVLPDAIMRWKDALVGAFVTSILFMFGRFIIGLYLGQSKVNLTYGAASAVVIILLWVYYASFILYLGAEFTKVYAYTKGKGIRPNETAVYIIKQEAKEMGKNTYLDEEEVIEDKEATKA